jgi:hypothetical protein
MKTPKSIGKSATFDRSPDDSRRRPPEIDDGSRLEIGWRFAF